MVMIAMAAMLVAVLAHHLGLSEAVAEVVTRIAECPKCLSFWTAMVCMVYCECPLAFAVLLSLLCAYMSNWVGLLLVWLARKYNGLWQRLNKRKR